MDKVILEVTKEQAKLIKDKLGIGNEDKPIPEWVSNAAKYYMEHYNGKYIGCHPDIYSYVIDQINLSYEGLVDTLMRGEGFFNYSDYKLPKKKKICLILDWTENFVEDFKEVEDGAEGQIHFLFDFAFYYNPYLPKDYLMQLDNNSSFWFEKTTPDEPTSNGELIPDYEVENFRAKIKGFKKLNDDIKKMQSNFANDAVGMFTDNDIE